MRLVFAGTSEFAQRALARLVEAGQEVALVLTRPDRPAGRGMQLSQSAVKRYALERRLELFQPETLKSPDTLPQLRAARADAIVVAAYGLLLPQPVLDLAPHGALNIHASLLPRWRGAAPIQRALLAGDRETGISIMRMESGLDTGPVMAQHRIPIDPDDDAASLHDKLALLGAEAILTALQVLAAGRAQFAPQPDSEVTYARKLGKRETILDWSRPAIELERAIRAFRPAPGAATSLEGEPLKLWRARVVPGRGTPGTLLSVGKTLVVACGADALEITELQRSGGRRLDAAAFARGRRLAAGTRFG